MNKMRLKYEPKRDSEYLEGFTESIFWEIKYLNKDVKNILDLGMGHGHLVKKLRESGFNAWGIDLRELGQDNLIVADAKNLPFKSKTFDVVIDCYLIADIEDFQEHTYEDIKKVLDEAKRVLKENGMFITVPSIEYSKKIFEKVWDKYGWGFYKK